MVPTQLDLLLITFESVNQLEPNNAMVNQILLFVVITFIGCSKNNKLQPTTNQ